MISNSANQPVEKHLSFKQQLAYVAPSLPLAFLFMPIGILQGIYAKYFGVTLATIATVLLVSRLFDAITDPLIGYFSDRHTVRTGSRKPFVLFGGLLFIVSSYFLYVPIDPNSINTSVSVSTPYFLGWFLLFYLAWTVMEIPHLAWGAELAPTSQDKSRIFSLRSATTYSGALLFYLVPLSPFFRSNDITPQTLQWGVLAASLLMLPSLYYCLKVAPNGAGSPKAITNKHKSVWSLRHEILANKPFLLFIAALSLFGVAGSGMWLTLMFIFVDSYLNLGSHFATHSLLGIFASICSIGIWYWLANRLGKKVAWGLGILMYLIGLLCAGSMAPDQPSVVMLSIVMLFGFVGSVPVNAISPSLLADIIDYSTWKFGSNNTATYFSLYMLTLKTSMALGGSIGLSIAAWYEFDPTMAVHTKDAIFGLRLAACWLPVLLLLISIVVMALVPINTHRHAIIRQRLDSRVA